MALLECIQQPDRCNCGGNLKEKDRGIFSATIACARCHTCSLVIGHRRFQEWIPLRDFHLKRGDGPMKRPFHDMGMAERLANCLDLDVWPSPAIVLDFGIASHRHFGALQHAVRNGITAYELDRVVGDGAALTRLIQAVPGQPYGEVVFQTVYDEFSWADEEEFEEL